MYEAFSYSQHMSAAAAERRQGTRGLGVAVEWRCVCRVHRVQSPEGTERERERVALCPSCASGTSVCGLGLLVYQALRVECVGYSLLKVLRERERQRQGQTDRQTVRQTDRQTDRQSIH